MASIYKLLGDYIEPVELKNSDGALDEADLRGISVNKEFIDTHANLVGVTFEGYKVVPAQSFAYIPDTSRRGDRIAIAFNDSGNSLIVSSICTVFKVVKTDQLDSEYLNLWFNRSEFDRYARFKSHGSAREVFDWDQLCAVELPIPEIDIQQKIVSIKNCIDLRAKALAEQNDYLEELGQVLLRGYIDECSKLAPLGDIMSFGNGFAFNSSSYTGSGTYKVLTIKNVQDGKVDCSTSSRVDRLPQRMKEFCRLQMGDVVLSLTGNVGRVGIVAEENCLLNQRVAVLQPFSKRNLPGLYFFFRQKSFQSAMIGIAKGTAQANLSTVETLQLSIPYEIEAFEHLSDDLKPIFDSILANMIESRYLAELRDALLPKLMAGEIDVSEISLCSD